MNQIKKLTRRRITFYNYSNLNTCSGFFLVLTNSSLVGIVPPSHPIMSLVLLQIYQIQKRLSFYFLRFKVCFVSLSKLQNNKNTALPVKNNFWRFSDKIGHRNYS